MDLTKPCRLWRGATNGRYGNKRINGRLHYVHRLAYEETNGPIPAGLHVLHHCDTPLCYEPEHLYLGTPSRNLQDAAKRGRMLSKLDSDEVLAIRALTDAGWRQEDVANAYGVSMNCVGQIFRRVSWRHLAEVAPCQPT